MNLIRLLFFPFSIIYGSIILVRNILFQKEIRKPVQFDVPIICIGNLSTGGTGKTPHTDLLIEKLHKKYEIGVLSRGYKRITKGFVRADESSTWEDVGDEPLQYFFKHNDKVSVQVDEERIRGVIHIMGDLPSTELILLDDAYQHRSLKAGFNILLTDYSTPFFNDFILPVGNLREFRSGKNRADYLVVTKCPENLSASTKQEYIEKIKANDNQKVFFSSIQYEGVFNLKNEKIDKVPENILLVTGIANPNPILEELSGFNVKHLKFPDHYRFKDRDIKKISEIFDSFADGNKIILTTLKDLMRLKIFKNFCEQYQNEIHYLDISIKIDNEKEFLEGISKYVDENKADSSLHQE